MSTLSASNPPACCKLIIDTLWKNAGSVVDTARDLGISKPFFWFLLRKHSLTKVPTEIRKEFRARYRVKL